MIFLPEENWQEEERQEAVLDGAGATFAEIAQERGQEAA